MVRPDAPYGVSPICECQVRGRRRVGQSVGWGGQGRGSVADMTSLAIILTAFVPINAGSRLLRLPRKCFINNDLRTQIVYLAREVRKTYS